MSSLSLQRPRLMIGAGLALVLAASATPLAAQSASAAPFMVPTPICPQAVASAGLPIIPVSPLDKAATDAGFTVVRTGEYPDGIVDLNGVIKGVAAHTQMSSFMLKAQGLDDMGMPVEKQVTCTMEVKAAPTVTRTAGTDRYDQSVQVSKATYPTGADVVYLASGEKYPDALSAAAIAGEKKAPLLLTQAGAIPASVLAEIKRVDPADVVIVGGPLTVSDDVILTLEAALPDATDVTRIGGVDRYAVSRALIANDDFGIATSDDVFVTTGASFPDALSAAPVAALTGAPVLLVNGAETVLTTDEKAILTDLAAKNAVIVGGEASVSAGLQTELAKGFTTTRRAGASRYTTSAAVNAGFTTADTVYLASGEVFPDALTGGAAAGAKGSPLVISSALCLGVDAAQTIGRLAPSKVVILGGTGTLGAGFDTLNVCKTD